MCLSLRMPDGQKRCREEMQVLTKAILGNQISRSITNLDRSFHQAETCVGEWAGGCSGPIPRPWWRRRRRTRSFFVRPKVGCSQDRRKKKGTLSSFVSTLLSRHSSGSGMVYICVSLYLTSQGLRGHQSPHCPVS